MPGAGICSKQGGRKLEGRVKMRVVQHVAILLLLLSCAVGQEHARIVVYAGQRVGAVNRRVLGGNIEAADSFGIFGDSHNLDMMQTGNGFWNPAIRSAVPGVARQCKAIGMSMLRYPGGCLAHNYDWRKTVGPVAKQNGWLFGLDEYLALCNALGVEPMITVSDYVLPADQMPAHAAELVEYLNAPADGTHPWAMKRKAWGHPDPYNVHWFELGNESIHGNHHVVPFRKFTPEQYAHYANAAAAAMRRVDPKIKIGIVMVPGAGDDVESAWNRAVVHLAGASADFVVVHLYAPQIAKGAVPEPLRAKALLAVADQSEHHLTEYHKLIARECGRDLPLAITEFNGYTDETRLSYAQALASAEMLRVFLKPELNVLSAHYWQFLNGFFGMLRVPHGSTTGEPQLIEPALPLFQLWGQHFGTTLVAVQIQGPRASFDSVGSMAAASGVSYIEPRLLQSFPLGELSASILVGWRGLHSERVDGGFNMKVERLSGSLYPKLASLQRPNSGQGDVEFRLEFDARFVPEQGSAPGLVGLGMIDGRGWDNTHSGVAEDGIGAEWEHFIKSYRLLPDAKSVDVTARLLGDNSPFSGTLEVRNLKVEAFVSEHYPAYSLLTAAASLSQDGRKLYLIVFNKSESSAIQTDIAIKGFDSVKEAHYWEVTGESLTASDGVAERKHDEAGPLQNHVFPPRSMTAIEISHP